MTPDFTSYRHVMLNMYTSYTSVQKQWEKRAKWNCTNISSFTLTQYVYSTWKQLLKVILKSEKTWTQVFFVNTWVQITCAWQEKDCTSLHPSLNPTQTKVFWQSRAVALHKNQHHLWPVPSTGPLLKHGPPQVGCVVGLSVGGQGGLQGCVCHANQLA